MSSSRRFGRSARSVALVAAGTLAFGVLPASTASAAHGTPFDLLAACEFAPESDLDSAGNVRLDFVEDCLNQWEGPDGGAILQGTNGAANFDATISRAQFAAVIVRVAAILGLDIPDAPATPTFSDVPTTAFFYEVIEQAAALGLFEGFDDGTFQPAGNISGAQFIAVLARLYRDALGLTTDDDENGSDTGLDCGFANDDLTVIENRSLADDSESTLPDSCADAALRGFVFDLIAALLTYEVAVGDIETPHQPPFVPFSLTTDLSVQFLDNGGIEVTATVKDENGDPVEGQRVDLTVTETGEETDNDGDLVPVPENGVDPEFDTSGDSCTGGECAEIDAGDPQTDADGQVITVLDENGSPDEPVNYTIFGFFGELGDTYEDDADESNSDSAEVSFIPGVDDVEVTLDTTTGAYPFGADYTATIQLVDDNNNPVALGGVEVLVQRQRDTGDGFNDVGASQVVTTGADGSAEVDYKGPADPDTANQGNSIEERVRAEADLDEDGEFDSSGDESDTSDEVEFLDAPAGTVDADETKLYVNAVNTFTVTAGVFPVNGQGRVWADVVDVYGNPVGGERVGFYTEDFGVLSATRTSSNSTGRATYNFTGPDEPEQGEIFAEIENDNGVLDVTIYNQSGTDDSDFDQVDLYFLETASTGHTMSGGFLLQWDNSGNKVGLDGDGGDAGGFDLSYFTYKAGDQFFVTGDGDVNSGATTAISLTDFEDYLEDLLADESDFASVNVDQYSTTGISQFEFSFDT